MMQNNRYIQCPIQNLSNELLLHVFSFILGLIFLLITQKNLDLRSLLTARIVCRLWSQIAIVNSNWIRFAQQILQNYQYDWSQFFEPHGTNVFRDTLATLSSSRSHSDYLESTQEVASNSNEHELYLPRENVRKVMKKVLPSFAKISKEALHCMQESATEFILFVLGEAAESVANNKRKTVNGKYTVEALQSLGLEEYYRLISIYVERLNKVSRKGKSAKKQKTNEKNSQHS